MTQITRDWLKANCKFAQMDVSTYDTISETEYTPENQDPITQNPDTQSMDQLMSENPDLQSMMGDFNRGTTEIQNSILRMPNSIQQEMMNFYNQFYANALMTVNDYVTGGSTGMPAPTADSINKP